jgi:hypothetical protein
MMPSMLSQHPPKWNKTAVVSHIPHTSQTFGKVYCRAALVATAFDAPAMFGSCTVLDFFSPFVSAVPPNAVLTPHTLTAGREKECMRSHR